MIRLTTGLLTAAAFVLVGCDRFQKEDDRICARPPVVALVEGDMNACIHKWAYRLAQSHEPAGIVAKAVVQACNDVANFSANRAAKNEAVMAAGDSEKVKSDAYMALMAVGEVEALFRVVQARAGHCDFP